MKRKLSYLLIIFISMFMYSVEVRAKTSVCTYNVGNVNLVVNQKGEDDISSSISGSDNENVFKGVAFDKAKSTIRKKDFYSNSGGFFCPKVTACLFEDTANANADGTVPVAWSLESDPKVKCTKTKSYSGELKFNPPCKYDKELVDGYTCVVEVTEAAGNTLSISKKKCHNVTEHLKSEYYYKNGKFECATGIWAQTTLYEGVIVYDLANSKEDLPDYGFESIVDDPGEPGDEDEDEDEDDEPIVTDDETLKILMRIYDIVKILIPILIILLSTVDFLKVVMYDDEKNYKSAFDKFVKRLIIGVVFFLLPILVSFVLKYSGISIKQLYLEIFK